KTILAGNKIYQYRSSQGTCDSLDRLVTYKVTKSYQSKITDKTDYYVIATPPVKTDSVAQVGFAPKPEKLSLDKVYYNPETNIAKDDKSFKYLDNKFAIQTLTIPLKFRKALDDGTKYPAQVETGVNIGFAPVYKWNLNIFNPTKKYMGKPLNTYSFNLGALLNLGATDLKASTNAPGLKSDRKSGTFTYGTFVMFGINNINFGYAVGWDKVLGEGGASWVYQNKLWQGVVIALDIIK
ncbi:MAG: hypothetical protein JWR50_1127, partial [Mucilaginibacter sp.]|nr:hypothetical protein [Mucilaginibacter sp.]